MEDVQHLTYAMTPDGSDDSAAVMDHTTAITGTDGIIVAAIKTAMLIAVTFFIFIVIVLSFSCKVCSFLS